MPKLPLVDGFLDPLRRPRYIIWSGVGILAMVCVMILALGVTSSRWFCANGCHKVQDDTLISYSHSAHDKISCIACHMPVNSTPIQFMLHKVEALGELYLTVTNQFELPLNEGDKLALDKEKMPTEQCTQCHDLERRPVTPSTGIIINHDVHIKKGITCTYCHNRTAHNENFDLTLPGNEKHEDFMKMQACFRCHTLTPDKETELGLKAPGTCSVCHTPGFQLKPPSHLDKGFFPKGHAKLAVQDKSYCLMCHNEQKFCYGCHAVPMPHPKDFASKSATSHSSLLKAGKISPTVCAKCHATQAGDTTQFCDNCHHKNPDPKVPWIKQHPNIVHASGAQPCFKCHNPVFCATCHVEGIQKARQFDSNAGSAATPK